MNKLFLLGHVKVTEHHWCMINIVTWVYISDKRYTEHFCTELDIFNATMLVAASLRRLKENCCIAQLILSSSAVCSTLKAHLAPKMFLSQEEKLELRSIFVEM